MVSSSAPVPGPQANRGSAIIEAKAEIYLSPSTEPIRGLTRLIVVTARSLKSLRFSGVLFHPAQGARNNSSADETTFPRQRRHRETGAG
jgi:hypothetical protein